MLSEIYCEKFKDMNEIRKPIKFHSGLNTVLGTSRAKNSIGKTTFLLVIDYCFGGRDYVELNTDIDKNVGIHTIYFTHEFDGEKLYFSRNTGENNIVKVCDNNYKEKYSISLNDFNNILLNKYQMQELGSTFRELINGYSRIYGKYNYYEQFPLCSFKNDKMESGIKRLLILYGIYGKSAELENQKNIAENERDSYRNAFKYQAIQGITTKTDYDNNNKKIKNLELEVNTLADKSSKGVVELASLQAQRIAELKKELAYYKRKKGRITNKLSAINIENDSDKIASKHDFYELETFFPNINIKLISDIENFHKKIKKILQSEFKEKKEELENNIKLVDSKIKELEDETIKIKVVPNVSIAILEDYSNLKQKIEKLKESNEYYVKSEMLNNKAKDLSKRLDRLIIDLTNELQSNINKELRRLNTIVCNENTSAPYLSIKNSKSYSYEIPNDKGTGSQTRGLMLFDMVVLNQTSLPLVIEDSVTLKQIEDSAILKIFELFNNSNKQVFIAIDKGESYSEDNKIPEIIKNTTVLKLEQGHELFGRAWNINTDSSETNRGA